MNDEARREERARAACRALHSTRLERGVVSLELLTNLSDLVEGRATSEELIQRALDQCAQHQERAVVPGLDQVVDQIMDGTLTLEEAVHQAIEQRQ